MKITRKIDKIIIHCSDTPNGKNFGVSDIDRWHKERGFREIGYHYIIKVNGMVDEGRSAEVAGAHCKGHNKYSLGICLIGRDRFNLAQWTSLFELIKDLKSLFPKATIHGHNELDTKGKTCPNFNVQEMMSHII